MKRLLSLFLLIFLWCLIRSSVPPSQGDKGHRGMDGTDGRKVRRTQAAHIVLFVSLMNLFQHVFLMFLLFRVNLVSLDFLAVKVLLDLMWVWLIKLHSFHSLTNGEDDSVGDLWTNNILPVEGSSLYDLHLQSLCLMGFKLTLWVEPTPTWLLTVL